VVGRCPTIEDAAAPAEWLADRLTRLSPDQRLHTEVQAGGGQFLLMLRA
jgi:hypothetical protein